MRLLRNALVGLVVLLLTVVSAVYGLSTYRLSRVHEIVDSSPPIPNDPVSLARGEHLVRAIAKCVDCHGESLGGGLVIDAGPVGTAYARNLTTGVGGIGGERADADFVRAIRHGVGANGRALRFMPSSDWHRMSDDDVAAIVAYIRSVPAVDNVVPATTVGPLGHALHVTGKLSFLNEAWTIPHRDIVRDTPRAGRTKEYGEYLATIGGCVGCHGPTLSGGPIPGVPPSFPPAANLTPAGIGKWTVEDFTRALRDGIRPAGTPIDPFMPIAATRRMTDDEIHALFLYLQTVPPREYGNR